MNIFDEEFEKYAGEKGFLVLKEIFKVSVVDDIGDQKLNLIHLRK